MPETRSAGEQGRLRALVRGRVQGVFFRDFTRRHAQMLGVVGWARNLSDGMTVEVIAEGPCAALEQLLEHLREGPPEAFVVQVDPQWSTPRWEFDSFEAC